MKRILFPALLVVLTFCIAGFGQSQRKKRSYVLPEVGDEVLVTFRQKQRRKTAARQRPAPKKYANQEVSYRKRKIKKTRRK